jgi:NRPS condensation-like uncharacterized protein
VELARPQYHHASAVGTTDGHGSAGLDFGDPVRLFLHLEASRRFHRDTGLGRVFHPGSLSLRENLAHDSLHVVVHRDRISAHVDRVSPLRLRPAGTPRYSVRRAAAHNLAGMAKDAMRLLRGRQGDHRSALDCRWGREPSVAPGNPGDLLDPSLSAWSLHVEVRVTGAFDEGRLRRAFGQVFAGRPADHDALLVLDCPDELRLDAARSQLQAAPVPLSEWPPVRALLARRGDGDVLVFNINHAASDGFGAVQIVRSIARAYAGEGDGDPSLKFLALMDLPVQPSSSSISPWRAWNRSTLERLRDRLARPAPLAADGPRDDPGVGFHLVQLTAEDTRRIVDADRPGTSRNVVLAALHLAIGEWNLRHETPAHRVGVLVQVNLRPPQWHNETIGNFSVTARVSTSRRHRVGPASALQEITGQTTRNQRTRSGIALIAALDRNGLLPLWAKQSRVVLQPLTLNRLIDTAMLSNLGSLEEAPSFGAGAGETVGMWFSSPSRAPLGLCVAAVTVDGRLHLVVRYPHRLFGPAAAQAFGESFLSQIFRVAETRGQRSRL